MPELRRQRRPLGLARRRYDERHGEGGRAMSSEHVRRREPFFGDAIGQLSKTGKIPKLVTR